MYTKLDLQSLGPNIVYLRRVAIAELPEEVQAEAGDLKTLFAVHNTKGEQVALVASPAVATHLAAANNMKVVALH
jgi:hypothetical protein